MNAFSPRRLLSFHRPPPLLNSRTIWGIALGTLISLISCTVISILCAQLGFYSRAITIVWTLRSDQALWRGALLGLLLGWLGRTPRHARNVCAFGFVLLVLNDWHEALAMFTPTDHLFDLGITLHYLLYTATIGTLTFCALRLHSHKQPQASPDMDSTTDKPVETATAPLQ